MSSPERPNLAPLKIIVYSMGFVLIGGIILLFAIIYQRNHASIPPAVAKITPPSTSCSEGQLGMSTTAAIDKMIKEGDILTLLTKEAQDGSQQIMIIDVCKGKILREIKVLRNNGHPG